jgi:mRNA-degrading endonuclease RelE of RelBE toxin-antitoxin system
MEFIETHKFTELITDILPDNTYSDLQKSLIDDPEAGDIIKASGGIRKIRWRISGHGKRGGIRIIYYWIVSRDTIIMLDVYQKNEQADLTPDQIKQLRRLVREELDNG